MHSPKRVIVTGASRGIGRALVDAFQNLGHEVWALSRNIDELKHIMGIHAVSIDLSDEQQILDWVGSCGVCLLYTSPSPRDGLLSRMPSSA